MTMTGRFNQLRRHTTPWEPVTLSTLTMAELARAYLLCAGIRVKICRPPVSGIITGAFRPAVKSSKLSLATTTTSILGIFCTQTLCKVSRCARQSKWMEYKLSGCSPHEPAYFMPVTSGESAGYTVGPGYSDFRHNFRHRSARLSRQTVSNFAIGPIFSIRSV